MRTDTCRDPRKDPQVSDVLLVQGVVVLVVVRGIDDMRAIDVHQRVMDLMLYQWEAETLEAAVLWVAGTQPDDTGLLRVAMQDTTRAFEEEAGELVDAAAGAVRRVMLARLGEDLARVRRASANPIPMILYCPTCGHQHIDSPDPAKGWDDPPHRSHLCIACGCVWRPCDVPTTGVERIETRGSTDTWAGHASATQVWSWMTPNPTNERPALAAYIDTYEQAIKTVTQLRAQGGPLLRRVRRWAAIPIAALARHGGMSQESLLEMEQGRQKTSFPALRALLQMLETEAAKGDSDV